MRKRWLQTTRPILAARWPAVQPIHSSRARSWKVAEPKPTPPEDAAAPGADPVAQLSARRPGPSERMMRRHHRLPEPAVAGVADRLERDRAELRQRAVQPGVGNLAVRDRARGGELRRLAGRRQRLRRRRQAGPAKGIAPSGPFAQLAGQTVAGHLSGAQGAGEPAESERIEMSEADLHACRIQDPDRLYRYVTLKGLRLSGVEIAIFESHRRIWGDLVRRKLPYAIILEDDVKLSASLRDVIEQIETISNAVDVLKLDGVWRLRTFGSPLADPCLEIRPILWQRVYSCGAYLVSREGAEKLLHWSTSYSDLVDAFVFSPLRNYRLYQLFPAIALQGHVMRNLTSHENGYVPTGSVPDVGVQRTPASNGPLWFRLMRKRVWDSDGFPSYLAETANSGRKGDGSAWSHWHSISRSTNDRNKFD